MTINKIDYQHLIQDKIYYYLNTIGYYPRQSYAFQKLKKNILIEETPEFEEYVSHNTLNIEYIIYKFICAKEELIEVKKEDLEFIKTYIEIYPQINNNENTFVNFVLSQFYHTITLNYNNKDIDENLTYKELKEYMFTNKKSEYAKDLNKSQIFLKNAINNNPLFACHPHIKYYSSKSDFKTLYNKEEIFKSSVNIENLENNIFFTGNPQAEYEYSQKIKNEELKDKLIISASRINRLIENPNFDIGVANAQWQAYNILKKETNWKKYNLPPKDEKVLFNLLKCAAKIEQILYDKDHYTGNNNALKLYYEIIKTKDPKKYKKELKEVKKFIEYIKRVNIAKIQNQH